MADLDRRSQNLLSIKLVNDTIVWEVGVEIGWEQRGLSRREKKGGVEMHPNQAQIN